MLQWNIHHHLLQLFSPSNQKLLETWTTHTSSDWRISGSIPASLWATDWTLFIVKLSKQVLHVGGLTGEIWTPHLDLLDALMGSQQPRVLLLGTVILSVSPERLTWALFNLNLTRKKTPLRMKSWPRGSIINKRQDFNQTYWDGLQHWVWIKKRDQPHLSSTVRYFRLWL